MRLVRSEPKRRLSRKEGAFRALLPHALRWLNMRDVAREAGVSRATMTRMFNGERTPTLRTGKRVALVMGITLDRLIAVLDQVRMERSKLLAEQAVGTEEKWQPVIAVPNERAK